MLKKWNNIGIGKIVVINYAFSEEKMILHGVQHGSKLRPLIINNIKKTIVTKTHS